jgi:hypothetical protein
MGNAMARSGGIESPLDLYLSGDIGGPTANDPLD